MSLLAALAVFYAISIAYLAFEMWRAPLVDDQENVLQEGHTIEGVLVELRLRYLGS